MPLRPLQILQAALALCLLITLYQCTTPGTPSSQLEAKVQPPSQLTPPNTEIFIPKTIHQLLLSMPGHPVSAFHPTSHSISWQQSGWKVEYWSEAACAQLAHDADPDAVRGYAAAFRRFPSAVLRSDFCRYLILFVRGGVYNDLDVRLVRGLPWGVMLGSHSGETLPPAVIIGMEGDASTTGLPRSPQFVQWTMVSTPGHPIFEGVLRRIVERTDAYLRQWEEDPGADVNVMDWTGPSVWTDAVLEYLDCDEAMLRTLQDLKETVRIKDVVVLPKRGFAITQGEDHSSPDVLVKHYFSGTWKTTDCRAWWRWIGRC
ncbi:putative alpha-1,6-mannosyltransferase subunit (Hoc1) [Aspergillus homomorphus CBS 101889]|uniref:Alpha-1,6-mannosyltransferase subunit n=1 Tax=Aspergillus homomorphus (strain CBS 101889) TaxID=1450537 RepID=A0A395I4K0_ASPHC|nr:alpha-1,6-mannosyltransferase subunit [Aspergillus homomorphus CBS 101889]RAL14695.1 alpha-1,6-mannosyltransferase subunit [Aspergillus homomorphus CBS 101889]